VAQHAVQSAGQYNPAATSTWEAAEDLANIALLRSVDTKALKPLLRYCEIKNLEVGEILIHAGTANRFLYLLLSGRLSVHLETTDNEPIAFIEAGESVGEISLIDNQPTSACVCAVEASRLLVIDEQLMWMLVNTSHAISTNLLFTLALRLRSGNTHLAESREQADKFRYQSMVDGLTGLYNRTWLKQMLLRQIQLSQQHGEAFSLLMLDIDHFKAFNDQHGHLAGDEALRTVSRTVKEHLRPTDMAARYGGEEFVVLLPETDREAARNVGERLRRAVSDADIRSEAGAALPKVTISLGLALMKPPCSPSELIHQADTALYDAKHAGRNRLNG